MTSINTSSQFNIAFTRQTQAGIYVIAMEDLSNMEIFHFVKLSTIMVYQSNCLFKIRLMMIKLLFIINLAMKISNCQENEMIDQPNISREIKFKAPIQCFEIVSLDLVVKLNNTDRSTNEKERTPKPLMNLLLLRVSICKIAPKQGFYVNSRKLDLFPYII